jgi:hypothetical protein
MSARFGAVEALLARPGLVQRHGLLGLTQRFRGLAQV